MVQAKQNIVRSIKNFVPEMKKGDYYLRQHKIFKSYMIQNTSPKMNLQKTVYFPLSTKTKCTLSVQARVALCGAAPRRMRITPMWRAAGRRAAPPGAGVARAAPPAGQSLDPTVCFHFMKVSNPVQLRSIMVLHGAKLRAAPGVSASTVAEVRRFRHAIKTLQMFQSLVTLTASAIFPANFPSDTMISSTASAQETRYRSALNIASLSRDCHQLTGPGAPPSWRER